MKKKEIFYISIICLLIINIINYFFLVTSYSVSGMKIGTTMFQHTFKLGISIRDALENSMILSRDQEFFFIIILLIFDLFYLRKILKEENFIKCNENYFYSYSNIVLACVGLCLNLFYSFLIEKPHYASDDTIHNMFSNYINVIIYAIILVLCILSYRNIGLKEEKHFNKLSIVSIILSLELIFSFFFFLITKNLYFQKFLIFYLR